MQMSDVHVPIMFLTKTARAPRYAHAEDAGADLFADEDFVLAKNGGRGILRTGVAVAIPEGYVGLVHPRSGLAAKHGVTVLNAPGTIDCGYTGEVKVIMVNHGPEHVAFRPGDAVAQLVIQKVEHATFHNVDELVDSARGQNGFGSTGLIDTVVN